MTPLFAFEDVHVGERLRGLSCEVPDAGVTVVRGPSGAGKSTLLRCCTRFEVPDAGVVRHRGEDVAALDVLVLRRRVAMLFQAPVLLPGTVAANLAEARPEDDPAALLERAGLDASFLGRDGAQLSGGEAQRVCLARALATSPRALLADEPTSALDPDAGAAVERLLRGLADGGVPVLLVTHDDAQARRLADAELVLEDGRLAGAG